MIGVNGDDMVGLKWNELYPCFVPGWEIYLELERWCVGNLNTEGLLHFIKLENGFLTL